MSFGKASSVESAFNSQKGVIQFRQLSFHWSNKIIQLLGCTTRSISESPPRAIAIFIQSKKVAEIQPKNYQSVVLSK